MKQVRVVVGEGDNKQEIGVAELNPIPNGDTMVSMTITDPKVAEMLGGTEIKGIIPSHPDMPPLVSDPVLALEDEEKENTDE